MNKLYQSLYDEFGEEQTHIIQRKLIAQTQRIPTHIELLAALSLEKGYKTKERSKQMKNTYHVTGELEKFKPVVDDYEYRQINTHVEAASPNAAIDHFSLDGWLWSTTPKVQLISEAMKLEEAGQPSLFPLPEKS